MDRTPETDPAAPTELEALIADALAHRDVVVESVRVAGAAATPTVEVLVDRAEGTEGLSLDEVAELSGLVSAALDAQGAHVPGVGTGEYLLEVGTVGVDRPLTEPRHWSRAVGRLVEVSIDRALPVTARVLAVEPLGVELQTVKAGAKKGMRPKVLPAEHVPFARLGPGRVQVEWATAQDADGPGASHTAEHTEA